MFEVFIIILGIVAFALLWANNIILKELRDKLWRLHETTQEAINEIYNQSEIPPRAGKGD